MITRDDVVNEAKSWVGTPYLHQGYVKGPQGGIDCAMILIALFRDYATVIPKEFDPRPYPMQWHLHRSEERYLNWFTQYARKVDVPQVGDIPLFRFGRTVSHSGIMISDTAMVHAYREAQAVIVDEVSAYAHRIDSYWSIF